MDNLKIYINTYIYMCVYIHAKNEMKKEKIELDISTFVSLATCVVLACASL